MKLLWVAAIAAALLGCSAPRNTDEQPPRTHEEWTALVAELRGFEKRIGYTETRNFLVYAPETESFPFCGSVSRLYLPYSYQDPAIRWSSVSEEECRAAIEGADVAFTASEALGERETPVTTSMLRAPLERFVYLVIHEDCHEQFELPYGLEEAACNVITYAAMTRYAEERFGVLSAERRALARYAREESAGAHRAIQVYERVAALYARHARGEASEDTLLRERDRLFRRGERTLAWTPGSMNNVWLANTMTYARHYPLMERVYRALDEDLPRTIAFLRGVDRTKPTPQEVVAKYGLKSDSGLEFVRAYEAELVDLIENMLPAARRT